MIRAAIWRGGSGTWYVDVASAEHFRTQYGAVMKVPTPHQLVPTRDSIAPTYAEAITLAHELIKKENERA